MFFVLPIGIAALVLLGGIILAMVEEIGNLKLKAKTLTDGLTVALNQRQAAEDRYDATKHDLLVAQQELSARLDDLAEQRRVSSELAARLARIAAAAGDIEQQSQGAS